MDFKQEVEFNSYFSITYNINDELGIDFKQCVWVNISFCWWTGDRLRSPIDDKRGNRLTYTVDDKRGNRLTYTVDDKLEIG